MADAEYELKGAHKKVKCEACHDVNPYEIKTETECQYCHRENDVHQGQEGETCDRCHDERNWTGVVVFDHDLTNFPLLGMHAMTACEECHLSQQFRTIKTSCIGCHEKDDSHKNALGDKCSICHNPNGWMFWQFDHDTQTDFSLVGKHKDIQCESCHKSSDGKKKALSCRSCHAGDDEHQGRYGRRCERCHNSNSWREVTAGGFR